MSRRKKLINNSVIPQYKIEAIARCLLPMIQAYYESDEGQAELAAWSEKKDAEDTRQYDK